MEDYEVFSKVTGGRPVFTSAAVSGGASEPQKRFHDPYLIRMQTI